MKKLWGSVGKRGLAFILSVTIVVTLIPNLGGIVYAEDDLSQTQSEQQADQSKDAGQDEAGVVLENDQGEAEQPSQDATTEDDSSQEVVSPQPEEGGGSDAPAVEEEKTENEDSSGSSAASSDEKEKDQTKEEKKTEYPAVSFERAADGMTVKIAAPEGALPEGTTVKVKSASKGDVKEAAGDIFDNEIKVWKAVDITFYDKDGNEIEPKEDVSVSFASAAFDGIEAPKVVHVTDNGKAKMLPGGDVSVKKSKVSFEADDFSVYAVIEENIDDEARATVVFMSEGEEIATMYVKNSDDAEAIKKILYDPGAGDLDDGQIFRGWEISQIEDPSYTAETKPNTIGDVRDFFEGLDITEGDKYYVHAMVFNTHKIYYKVGDVTIENAVALSVGDEAADYTVDMSYVPDDPDQQFQGWYIRPAENATEKDGTAIDPYKAYANGTEIKVTGDLNMTVKAPRGKWLIFKENGKGASYTPPQFLEPADVTVEPADPTRFGYTFDGWYTDAACTEDTKFEFGSTITDNTIVYAKWKVNDPAEYSVIIWKENPECDGYDYADSKTLTGTPGDTASDAVSISGEDEKATATVDGTKYEYKGFHYAKTEATNDDEIKPDGTTVVNVYYDRTEYTVKFYYARSYAGGSNYEYTVVAHTSNNGTPTWQSGYSYQAGTRYYQRDNGSYREVTYSNGRFYGNNGRTVNNKDIYIREESQSQNYAVSMTYDAASPNWSGTSGTPVNCTRENTGTETRTEGGRTYTYYYATVTAKYGTSISDMWPAYSEFPAWGDYSLVSWALMPEAEAAQTGQATVKGKITIMDEQVLGDMTDCDGNYLYANYESSARTVYDWMYYAYVELAPGETASDYPSTRVYHGKTYGLKEQITARSHGSNSTWKTQQHPPKYAGFESPYYDNATDTVIRGELTTAPRGYDYAINYYYDRESYGITFMDGKYVNGDGIEQDDRSSLLFKESEALMFGSDISGYNESGDKYYVPQKDDYAGFDPKGYVFAGWYVDPECTTKISFNKMPEGGIIAYAKWIKIQYRIFLNPRVPTSDTTFEMGDQKTSFRIDWGGTINQITAVRDEYELIGWYYDKNTSKTFNFDAYTLNGQTPGLADYDQTRPTETDKYGNWDDDTNADAENNRFWITKSLDLYAKWRGQLIGADGINVEYDANGGSNAPEDGSHYLDNSNAVAQSASTAPDSDHQFLYWIPQKWNEKTGKFEDLDQYVYPGDTFTVLKDNAKVTPNDDNTPEDPSFTYTVRLRAEYGPTEAPTPTHINWYKNEGSDALRKDKDLEINETVNIEKAPSRDGFVFLGWARVEIGDTAADAAEWEADSSNWEKDLTADDLYLFYGDDSKFHLSSETGKAVAKVAADEEKPFHAMMAVWKKKIEITVKDKTSPYNGEEQNGYTITEVTGTSESTISTDEYIVKGLREGETLTVSGYTPSKGTDFGTYKNGTFGDATITVTDANGRDVTSKYKIETTAGDLTITKPEMDLTVEGYEDEYDGDAHGVKVTPGVTSGTTIYYSTKDPKGDDFDPDNDWSTDALEYTHVAETPVTVYVKAVNPNYDVAYGDATVKITKKSVNIKIDSDEKTYGDNDPEFDDASIGEYIGTELDDIDLSVSRLNDDEGVGKYDGVLTISKTQEELNEEYTDYDISIEDGDFEIKPKAVTITAKDASKTYNGSELTESGFTVDGLAEGDDHEFTVVMTDDSTITNVGTKANVIATVDGTAVETGKAKAVGNYLVTTANGELEIEPKEVTITAKDASKVYDSKELTEDGFKASDLEEGDTHEFTVVMTDDSTITDVGTKANVIATVDGTAVETGKEKAIGNYLVTTVNGELEIEPRKVTITAKDATWLYTGTSHTENGFTVEGLADDDDHEFTVEMTQSSTVENIGEYSNVIATVDGVAVTTGTEKAIGNYLVTTVDGLLRVIAKAVTIKANDASKEYDGTALTESGFTVEGLADDDDHEFKVVMTDDSTITDFGTQSNVIATVDGVAVTTGEKTVVENYLVTIVDGLLTIDKAPASELGLKAENYSGKYDGEEHVVPVSVKDEDGTKITYSLDNETWSEETPTWTDATDGAVPVYVKAENPNYETATTQATVEITKREVTLTSASAQKTYDGTPLTDSTVTVSGDGFVGEEESGVTYEVTGSQLEVGESDNTFDVIDAATGKKIKDSDSSFKDNNYDFEKVYGKLTVAKAQDPNDDVDDDDDNGGGNTDTKKPHDSKSTKAQKPADSAQTGDQTEIMVFMMLMLTAMAVMIIMVAFSRRRRRED